MTNARHTVLTTAGLLLPIVAGATAAGADVFTELSRSVRVHSGISLQVAPDPPQTAGEDRTDSDPSHTLVQSVFDLGNTGGQSPYAHTSLSSNRSANTPSTDLGFSASLLDRLWTGGSGPGCHISGFNEVVFDSTFSIVTTNTAYPFQWSFWGSSGPHSVVNPITSAVHARGVEFSITDEGGAVIAQTTFTTAGFDQVNYFSFNTPFVGTLSTGTYSFHARCWAEWVGIDLAGAGWSDASANFVIRSTIPAPVAVAPLLSLALLARFRRRRSG